jgi:hypothetical protein
MQPAVPRFHFTCVIFHASTMAFKASIRRPYSKLTHYPETLMRAHLDEAMGHIRSFWRPDVERSVEDTFAAFGPLDGSEVDAACSNCTPE